MNKDKLSNFLHDVTEFRKSSCCSLWYADFLSYRGCALSKENAFKHLVNMFDELVTYPQKEDRRLRLLNRLLEKYGQRIK
jgi:hypothetical protein